MISTLSSALYLAMACSIFFLPSKQKGQTTSLHTSICILSFVIWFLDYSQWADGFRINSGAHNDEKSNGMRKSWMIYFLPLLKVTIITTIPALITGGIIRLKKRIRITST